MFKIWILILITSSSLDAGVAMAEFDDYSACKKAGLYFIEKVHRGSFACMPKSSMPNE